MKYLITFIVLSFVSTSKSEAQNWYQIAYNKLNVGETIHLYDENWKGVFKSSQNWLDNAKYYRVVTYLGENNFSFLIFSTSVSQQTIEETMIAKSNSVETLFNSLEIQLIPFEFTPTTIKSGLAFNCCRN